MKSDSPLIPKVLQVNDSWAKWFPGGPGRLFRKEWVWRNLMEEKIHEPMTGERLRNYGW